MAGGGGQCYVNEMQIRVATPEVSAPRVCSLGAALSSPLWGPAAFLRTVLIGDREMPLSRGRKGVGPRGLVSATSGGPREPQGSVPRVPAPPPPRGRPRGAVRAVPRAALRWLPGRDDL